MGLTIYTGGVALVRGIQVLQQSGDRSIDNPSSLEGATPEEVEEAAREAGFTERGDPPRNDPNGARLRKPGNPADQVRI